MSCATQGPGGGLVVPIHHISITIGGGGDSDHCCSSLLIVPDHQEKEVPGVFGVERLEPPFPATAYTGDRAAIRIVWLVTIGWECRYEDPLRIGRYDTYERVRLCDDDDELDQIDVD